MSNTAWGFAPANVALCKYWGKRDVVLNTPDTSSLSISLGGFGAYVVIELCERDQLLINNAKAHASYFDRTFDFIRQICGADLHFNINSYSRIPTQAGLASSASYFAALTIALNKLLRWDYAKPRLINLAGIGSGSARRSFDHGFVECVIDGNGTVSTNALDVKWPEFCVGLLILDAHAKRLTSREAMAKTQQSSRLYKDWVSDSAKAFERIKSAVMRKSFEELGRLAEENAIAMHKTIEASGVIYSSDATSLALKQVRALREQGVSVYATQDAGPNLKLLFLEESAERVSREFDITIVRPFLDAPADGPASFVIEVDESGRYLGFAEKLAAHRSGTLHLAVSVMLKRTVNGAVEVLLQKRSELKYHSKNLWSNSSCTHTQLHETPLQAALRSVETELGLKNVALRSAGKFIYQAKLSDCLYEHEYDEVFVGECDTAEDLIPFNTQEVAQVRWTPLEALRADLALNPSAYTAWLSRVTEKSLEGSMCS